MKTSMHLPVLSVLAATGLIMSLGFEAYAYRLSDMVLRDANGVAIAPGSSTPYSPKQTCGAVECHIDMVKSYGMSSGNVYESDIGYAGKDHGAGTLPYTVPYPKHGVSAGFHFQKGRNIPWSRTQRDYYGLPDFTSSSGMYGKVCLSSLRQLADLNATSPSNFDMSSYDFAHSECAWCHVGGGPLEYDREGYRYDGTAGLFQTGFNPSPKQGDYYSVDAQTGGIVSKASAWQDGGGAEVDCFLCHLAGDANGFRYSMLERNYAFSEAQAPRLAASLGLAGPAGTTGYLQIARKGSEGMNPDVSPAGWSWVTTTLDHAVIISPDKENCALCHFVDKTLMTNGPASKPLGFTSFQKYIPAGSADDGDKVVGGRNDSDWKFVKVRAESDKRAESINDPLNSNAHMDKGYQCSFCHYLLGTPRDYDTDCMTCHYDKWGYSAPPPITPVTPQVVAALTDASGNVVLPAVEVLKIDHQFAKGNNLPDGMNLDQMDNTATCESCHITRTHPNAGIEGQPGAAQNPAAAHAGFPAFHFSKIDCRTCHVPVLNGPVKRILADFTAGPYQASERAQTIEDPAGVNYKPLYMWRSREHNGGRVQIVPTTTITIALWANRGADGSLAPLFQRTAQEAAELFRSSAGSTGGVYYDWTLNRPQNGDTALIVNTPPEIIGMVAHVRALGFAEPVMDLYFNQFTPSHNVMAKSHNAILGSPAGGGCIMCHSSSDPSSPNYTPRSAGFFDKTHTLFEQPTDGGAGLVQTVLPDLSGTALRRVEATFSATKPDGSSFSIDLSRSDGQTVGNRVNQGTVLGYSSADLSSLMNPGTAGVQKPLAYFIWAADTVTSNAVTFNASGSACANTPCAYSWSFGDNGTGDGIIISHTYAASGSYNATLTITDAFGFRSSVSRQVTAGAVNTPPTLGGLTITNGVITGGIIFTDAYTVSFTDQSVDGQDLQSSLRIAVNWGDGTQSTGSGGSTFAHTYATAGTYTITHTVMDRGGLSAAESGKTAVPQKFGISGTVSHGAGPFQGVLMILKYNGNTKATTTTAADGGYSFTNVLPGAYAVQPYKSGYTFTPATATVTVGPDATGVNFTATP